jgi:MFS transporter, ACS family, D-galactonate transporter
MNPSLKSISSPSPVTECSPALRWRILLLLMALCFISHFNRISMTIAGDERIMPKYGFRPEQMGRVYAVFLVVYTTFMALGGVFIDRVGVRVALATMAIGSGAFAVLTGVAGLAILAPVALFSALVLIRGTMGLVTTPLHPASAQAVSNWFPESARSLANGLVTAAALFGVAFTYPLFGKLMDTVGWANAFAIAGTATVILGLVWFFSAEDSPTGRQVNRAIQKSKEKGDSTSGNWISLLTHPSLLLLTLSYAAVGYFQYLFFYWMHYYFETIRHFGKEESRWYTTIPILAMAICMASGGWVSDRMQLRYGRRTGRKIVPIVGMILSAAFLGLGLMTEGPAAIVFWFALSMGAVGACESAFWLTAVELGGRRGGTSAAIINTGGNGIGLLAPLFTPAISASIGWKWGIAIGGLICIVGGICWCFIRLDEVDSVESVKVESLNIS